MTKDLIEILSWCRGANTKSEADFVKLHIATIPGIERDTYGNYHLQIGNNPICLWSCHTDTVTRKEGRQNVKWIGKGILGLKDGKPGSCLGADDGAGVYLMKEMIKEGKEGYYVFHRDEEIGGLGSSYLKDNPQYFPESIQMAIAMDRAGTGDVITHQGFSRCCSQDFANRLADKLGKGWMPDDSGVFTDTANYVGLIPECTNLSVGYENNHGPREVLDTYHLLRLRDSILELDVSDLPIVRDVNDDDDYGYGGFNFERWRDEYDSQPTLTVTRKDPILDYAQLVQSHPGIAARLLEDLGVEAAEFRAHVYAFTGMTYTS